MASLPLRFAFNLVLISSCKSWSHRQEARSLLASGNGSMEHLWAFVSSGGTGQLFVSWMQFNVRRGCLRCLVITYGDFLHLPLPRVGSAFKACGSGSLFLWPADRSSLLEGWDLNTLWFGLLFVVFIVFWFLVFFVVAVGLFLLVYIYWLVVLILTTALDV